MVLSPEMAAFIVLAILIGMAAKVVLLVQMFKDQTSKQKKEGDK